MTDYIRTRPIGFGLLSLAEQQKVLRKMAVDARKPKKKEKPNARP